MLGLFSSKPADPQTSSSVLPSLAEVTVQCDVESGIKNPNGSNGTIAEMPIATATAITTPGWAPHSTTTVLPEPTTSSDPNFEREKTLVGIYQISRFIRIVTVLDIGFIIVFSLFSPIFCVLLPFPICGYFGAKRWIYKLLFVYSMYLILEVIGGIVSAIFIANTAFIVVRVIYIFMNLVIARYSIKLCSYILVFEDEDREFLKTSPVITTIEKSLLC